MRQINFFGINWKINCKKGTKTQPPWENQRIPRRNQKIMPIRDLTFQVTTKLLWVSIRPLAPQVERWDNSLLKIVCGVGSAHMPWFTYVVNKYILPMVCTSTTFNLYYHVINKLRWCKSNLGIAIRWIFAHIVQSFVHVIVYHFTNDCSKIYMHSLSNVYGIELGYKLH